MIKVKIKKEKVLLNSFYSLKFVNYSNKLTEVAKNHKGFISSNSYFSDDIDTLYKNNIKIITISEWKNKKCWNDWFNSKDRKIISDEFINIHKEEDFNILFKRSVNDTFLL